MTQPELERSVARATGESRQLIREMGFTFIDMPLPRRRRRRRRRWFASSPRPRPTTVLQTA